MLTSASKMPDLGWRKATASLANGECVEVAPVTGRVAVRNSKNPGREVLLYSAGAWRSFLYEAKESAGATVRS
jgi:hypothetical protein